MKSKEIIALNIRKIRKASGLSQEQLASDLDIDPVTIRYYEGGKRFPKPDFLDAMAKRMDVPLASFFEESKSSLITKPSQALRAYMAIPDEIITLAQGVDEKTWERVKQVLEAAHERISEEATQSRQGRNK